MKRQTILSLTIFFLIAFGLTFAFSKLPATNFYSVDAKDILCGFGPLISGLICYRIFKTPTAYSIGGRQAVMAWMVVLITVVTFMLTNTKDSLGANAVFAAAQLIYCFGEEFGWRHYLQSATNGMNKWLQPFIIGLVWFAWHFSWLQHPIQAMMGQNMAAPVPAVVISVILALSVASFLLGLLMNKTQAILLPTVLHFAVKANVPTIGAALALVIIAVVTMKKAKAEHARPAIENDGG